MSTWTPNGENWQPDNKIGDDVEVVAFWPAGGAMPTYWHRPVPLSLPTAVNTVIRAKYRPGLSDAEELLYLAEPGVWRWLRHDIATDLKTLLNDIASYKVVAKPVDE